MASIYELKKEHIEALSELEFAEDDEEIHAALNRIQGDVSRKLEFLTTILAESMTKAELSKITLQLATERLGKNKKRDERTVEKLREFILSICVDFDISKFKGEILSVSHNLTPGALIFSDKFDIDLLPDEFVTVIPEHKELDNKALLEKLRAGIYRPDLKKLDPNVTMVADNALPGIMLERKESLRVS